MKKGKDEFIEDFAQRLVCALKDKGLSSSTAKSGVRVIELAEAINCSKQNVRNYVMGTVLPDSYVVKTIADWLELDPGYLLFGHPTNPPKPAEIAASKIDYNLLKQLVSECLLDLFKEASSNKK